MRLEYCYFPIPAERDERLAYLTTELTACVDRIGSATTRLEDVAAAEPGSGWTSSLWDDVGYHAEVFLTHMYELRNRLILVLAALSNVAAASLLGKGGHQRRLGALNELRGRAPMIADGIAAAEAEVSAAVWTRGILAHEGFVHLMLVAEENMYDPGDVRVDLESMDEQKWVMGREALGGALRRFVGDRRAEHERIAALIVTIVQAVGGDDAGSPEGVTV